jgi:hypothetical protein
MTASTTTPTAGCPPERADATTIAVRGLGLSAPPTDFRRRFGFTPEAIADAARAQSDGRAWGPATPRPA